MLQHSCILVIKRVWLKYLDVFLLTQGFEYRTFTCSEVYLQFNSNSTFSKVQDVNISSAPKPKDVQLIMI